MNEYNLKITGMAALAEQLDATKALAITAELEIYEVAKRDLQNGDFNIIYKGKIVSAIDCLQDKKVVKGKDPKKASQRLRAAIRERGTEEGVADDEVWYQSEMARIILAYNNNEV